MTSEHAVVFMWGFITLWILAGCASTPQSRAVSKHPPANLPQQIELERVPFFPQSAFQCGPAALATVLNDRNIRVTPDDLVDKVYIPKRKGSLQIEMIATARRYGLVGYQLEPQLSALLKEISHGNPVLVFQNLTFSLWPKWHYAVVVGYNMAKRELILRSGTHRRYVIDFAVFERTWQRAEHWAYVFTLPGEIPMTAEPGSYVRAVLALEHVGYNAEALTAYRKASEKWPDSSIVMMALGNAEYAAGNYNRAESAFDLELNSHPRNARAWNNIAYVFKAKSCPLNTLVAVYCAERLAPQDRNIRNSVAELSNIQLRHQTKGDSGECQPIECPLAEAALMPSSD
jgi:tetratricopeptide (TPR) repeat protein